MPFIAEKTGLNLKRAERAVRDLVKSGLITVHPLCEKLSDTLYKGYAAIRTISAKLFTIFGLGGRLRYEREKASARLKKRTRKEEAKGKAKVDLILSSTLGPSGPAKTGRVAELRAIKAILNSP